jgi:hypothetical protein
MVPVRAHQKCYVLIFLRERYVVFCTNAQRTGRNSIACRKTIRRRAARVKRSAVACLTSSTVRVRQYSGTRPQGRTVRARCVASCPSVCDHTFNAGVGLSLARVAEFVLLLLYRYCFFFLLYQKKSNFIVQIK